MKTMIKSFFRVASVLSPHVAGSLALDLFQRPLNKKLRKREKAFFERVGGFSVPFPYEDIQCYELGPTDGNLVIMVHGWESNAASLSAIAERLAAQGCYVVLFNLPAHGFSKLKKANLKISSDALLAVIDHINPIEPFSIVSHSFGSAVTSYALSKIGLEVDQLVFLTTPNKLTDVFDEYGRFIGLSKRASQKMNDRASKLLREPLDNMRVDRFGELVRFNRLTIIHDVDDKIINVEKARTVSEAVDRVELVETNGKGHYRMLWDSEVVDRVGQALIKDKEQLLTN